MLACLLVPLPGLDPCAPVSSVDRDPHLHFAHGGRADFRGEHGRTYSFLSAPGLAVNIKTEDAVFRMNGGRLVVHGSFITEAHVVARAAGSKFAFVNASFWARELREDNWGWQVTDHRGLRPDVFQDWQAGFQGLPRAVHSHAVLQCHVRERGLDY